MLQFILIAVVVGLLPATNFFGLRSSARDAYAYVPMTDAEFWARSERMERRAAFWEKAPLALLVFAAAVFAAVSYF